MREISATEAARRMGDLLSRVKYRGESFLIRRGRTVVAQLGPPATAGATGRDLAIAWRNLRHVAPREAKSFSEDIERGRRQTNKPPRDPWQR
jgi:hypothetical protein